MTIFSCPFCGERPLHEFHFRKSAASATAESAIDAVYLRDNHLFESIEYWQHLHGCRDWLLVRRDPSTARVIAVQSLASIEP